jgi:ABC-type histidine transport system ATPase subunit
MASEVYLHPRKARGLHPPQR